MNERTENRASEGVAIRLATSSDAEVLAKLRFAFRSSLDSATEQEDEFVQRCSVWMRDRLEENSCWRCWIAEQGRSAIGSLWMQIIEKVPNPIVEPEYHGYVTNVYVCEEARGRGIGSMLLSAALAWVKAKDIHSIILWPTEQSRSLYARHGFVRPDDILELILSQPLEGERA